MGDAEQCHSIIPKFHHHKLFCHYVISPFCCGEMATIDKSFCHFIILSAYDFVRMKSQNGGREFTVFVTVASYKGGVGKTTTAVHFAAFLQRLAPTLLIDGDPNRSATSWARRGAFPFQIADEREGAYQARHFTHVVIDTEARPGNADFEAL